MDKFIKFGIVGILNTGITIIIFNLLRFTGIDVVIVNTIEAICLNFNVTVVLSGMVVANSIGYICGMINSYFWNNKWVFKSNSKDIATVIKFIVVNLIAMCINNYMLILLVKNIGINEFIAQIIALVLITIINFIGNKLWTFNK